MTLIYLEKCRWLSALCNLEMFTTASSSEVAEFVVDAFKVVDIAQDQAQRCVCALVHIELPCEQYVQVATIIKAGQLVGF